MPPREELQKYSNPSKVSKNAVRYFGKVVPLYISDKPNKKYMIQKPDGSMVYFGEMGYEDYTRHGDSIRRNRYLTRASNIRGNWKTDMYSPNRLSMALLWM
jgi:hypothetical protein